MKPNHRSLTHKFTVLAWLLAAALIAVLVAGCGNETDKANQLVDEVNAITQDTGPKFDEVEKLLTQASAQLGAGRTEAEKATLDQALKLLDEIIPQIEQAKAKTEEAAGLQISDSYRQYLQAKSRAIDASLVLTQISRQLTNTYLADPTLQNPDTLPKIDGLRKNIEEQIKKLNDAETEAARIAAENAEEIEQ